MKEIKKIATELANDICEMTIINNETLSEKIYLKIVTSMSDILKSKLSEDEKEYFRLLDIQAELVGTKKYVELGYKLAVLKKKKATSNRIMNDMRETESSTILKRFIVDKFGIEKLNELLPPR